MLKSLVTTIALCAMGAAHAECFRDGSAVTLQGTASAQTLTLANGSVKTVSVLNLTAPICATENVDPKDLNQNSQISRIQVIGVPPPLGVLIELTGSLSTGNFTQYDAVSTAITVAKGRRIRSD
jgi:hypothetical protein